MGIYCEKVRNLESYLSLAQLHPHSNEFIFRAVSMSKKENCYKLRMTSKPLSLSRTRETVLEAIKNIGLDPKDFVLHSLRSGGATANAGIPDRLFNDMADGNWTKPKTVM